MKIRDVVQQMQRTRVTKTRSHRPLQPVCRRSISPTVLVPVIAIIFALASQAAAESIKPAVPPGIDPGGIAVAHIDTGVNYTLPDISRRLARKADGSIFGYDFADDDHQPFDLAPGRKGPSAIRHGTGVAAILLREAPQARLIPYRFKAGDPSVFAKIVEAIATSPARIAAMPLGGYHKKDWLAFRDAALAHPEILFVLSAGNEGWNLDERQVFPAAFGLENSIVVTSTDPFARIPADSNWGPGTVDISTPAERLKSITHEGAPVYVSGSSYAVPRIAALAARLKARNPDWTTAQLKSAILSYAGPSPADRTPVTKHGWIPDPLRLAAP